MEASGSSPTAESSPSPRGGEAEVGVGRVRPEFAQSSLEIKVLVAMGGDKVSQQSEGWEHETG